MKNIKKHLIHPQIDIDFYSWWSRLTPEDKSFLDKADSFAAAMFVWARSRTSIQRSPISAEELKRQGGQWMGEIHEFMLQRAYQGDCLTWGSDDFVRMPQLTVKEMEELAARIAASALND